MTTIKTNSKAFTTLVSDYILNAIDSTPYGIEAVTEAEKLQFLADTFKSEYCYPENLKRYGSYQNVLAQWIAGLPSVFNIDYENYRILELAKEWGTLEQNANEAKEDKVIANWFNMIAFKTISLMRKHNINLND